MLQMGCNRGFEVGINNNPERISKLKRFETDFDWPGIGFPVSVKDIKKFELRNQISINLLAIEGKQIYICRKRGNYECIINLMLITENNRKHYVAIKSLSRLLSSQNTKHKGKEYFCMNCLQGFNKESSRDEHLDYCINNESVKVEMPHKEPIVQRRWKVLSSGGDRITAWGLAGVVSPPAGPGQSPGGFQGAKPLEAQRFSQTQPD